LIQKGFWRFDAGSDDLCSPRAFVKLKNKDSGKPLLTLAGRGHQNFFQEKFLSNFA
jgi:hypothetical protein